jgi:hypothetical protein
MAAWDGAARCYRCLRGDPALLCCPVCRCLGIARGAAAWVPEPLGLELRSRYPAPVRSQSDIQSTRLCLGGARLSPYGVAKTVHFESVSVRPCKT